MDEQVTSLEELKTPLEARGVDPDSLYLSAVDGMNQSPQNGFVQYSVTFSYENFDKVPG
jgi:hypothetical protein